LVIISESTPERDEREQERERERRRARYAVVLQIFRKGNPHKHDGLEEWDAQSCALRGGSLQRSSDW